MTDFKANIIKLEKCVVYQPLYINPDLYKKCERYVGTINVGSNMDVYYRSSPNLGGSYIYFGFEYCGTGYVSYKIFDNNEQRDIYYDNLMKVIKLAIDHLKSV